MSRNNDSLPMLPPWLSESDVSQAGYEAPVENLPHEELIDEVPKRRRFLGRGGGDADEPRESRRDKRKGRRRSEPEAPAEPTTTEHTGSSWGAPSVPPCRHPEPDAGSLGAAPVVGARSHSDGDRPSFQSPPGPEPRPSAPVGQSPATTAFPDGPPSGAHSSAPVAPGPAPTAFPDGPRTGHHPQAPVGPGPALPDAYPPAPVAHGPAPTAFRDDPRPDALPQAPVGHGADPRFPDGPPTAVHPQAPVGPGPAPTAHPDQRPQANAGQLAQDPAESVRRAPERLSAPAQTGLPTRNPGPLSDGFRPLGTPSRPDLPPPPPLPEQPPADREVPRAPSPADTNATVVFPTEPSDATAVLPAPPAPARPDAHGAPARPDAHGGNAATTPPTSLTHSPSARPDALGADATRVLPTSPAPDARTTAVPPTSAPPATGGTGTRPDGTGAATPDAHAARPDRLAADTTATPPTSADPRTSPSRSGPEAAPTPAPEAPVRPDTTTATGTTTADDRPAWLTGTAAETGVPQRSTPPWATPDADRASTTAAQPESGAAPRPGLPPAPSEVAAERTPPRRLTAPVDDAATKPAFRREDSAGSAPEADASAPATARGTSGGPATGADSAARGTHATATPDDGDDANHALGEAPTRDSGAGPAVPADGASAAAVDGGQAAPRVAGTAPDGTTGDPVSLGDPSTGPTPDATRTGHPDGPHAGGRETLSARDTSARDGAASPDHAESSATGRHHRAPSAETGRPDGTGAGAGTGGAVPVDSATISPLASPYASTTAAPGPYPQSGAASPYAGRGPESPYGVPSDPRFPPPQAPHTGAPNSPYATQSGVPPVTADPNNPYAQPDPRSPYAGQAGVPPYGGPGPDSPYGAQAAPPVTGDPNVAYQRPPAPESHPDRSGAPQAPYPPQAPAPQQYAAPQQYGSGEFAQPAPHYGPQGHPQQPVQGFHPPSLDNVPVRRAKKAPGAGWRKAVHHMSGGAINPGMSAEERRLQELVARIRQPVRGDYRIAVLSLKGGVGKTTTTMGLGSIFASIRGDRVIAVDANPDFGTLSQRVSLQTRSTVRDLLLDQSIERYSDVRRHTSQGSSRLEVLASERDPAASEAFNDEEYRAVARILQRFYNIILTDCGTGLMHSAMSGVLDLAHSLVLISSAAIDGARSAAATLDWLSLHGHDHLVRNAVVVINLPREGSPNVGVQQLREYFLSRCRAVHIIPYDAHLSEGAEIDLHRLHKTTKRAYVELAATVADDFAADHRHFP
ncbi:nucleotide-binding protein [Nocardia thailandica]